MSKKFCLKLFQVHCAHLLLLPLDPEEPDPATLYGSSSLDPDPKGLNCGGAPIRLNGPGADCARYRLIPIILNC